MLRAKPEEYLMNAGYLSAQSLSVSDGRVLGGAGQRLAYETCHQGMYELNVSVVIDRSEIAFLDELSMPQSAQLLTSAFTVVESHAASFSIRPLPSDEVATDVPAHHFDMADADDTAQYPSICSPIHTHTHTHTHKHIHI